MFPVCRDEHCVAPNDCSGYVLLLVAYKFGRMLPAGAVVNFTFVNSTRHVTDCFARRPEAPLQRVR